jgi:prophage regulatory protein
MSEPLSPTTPPRLLRQPEVQARTGLHAEQRRRLELKGDFPRRIALGARTIGWREDEVAQWVEARIKGGK